MNKETIELYATLETQKREIEDKQEQIKKDALVFLKESGADKVESEFGSFRVVGRKSWKYSEKVSALKEQVKKEEATEQEDGTATAEMKESVTFYPIKV